MGNQQYQEPRLCREDWRGSRSPFYLKKQQKDGYVRSRASSGLDSGLSEIPTRELTHHAQRNAQPLPYSLRQD
jgi:hypothetical protein